MTQETALMVIDGEDVAAHGGDWFETRDPATGRVLAEVPRGGAADIDAAVRAARRAQPAWGALAAAERGRILQAIADGIAEQAEELTRLETLDVGKPLHEARVDIGHAERLFRFYGEVADKIPAGRGHAAELAAHRPARARGRPAAGSAQRGDGARRRGGRRARRPPGRRPPVVHGLARDRGARDGGERPADAPGHARARRQVAEHRAR
jgi:hypothetical protein